MTKDILEQMTHKSIKNVPAYLLEVDVTHLVPKLTHDTPVMCKRHETSSNKI